jgi:hypothetical protein
MSVRRDTDPETAQTVSPMKRESKPAWSEVPREAKAALEGIVGAPIIDAAIAWGGYGPSATFILRTASGRKFFCKGTHPGFTEGGKAAFHIELSYYQAIPELAEFGPAFRGAVHHEDWHLLVLDYVERAFEVPPWTEAAHRDAISMLARFHSRTPANRQMLPTAQEQSGIVGLYQAESGWKSLADADNQNAFVALFSDRAAAARWLNDHLADFMALEASAAHLDGPRSWVHHDVRSDNLLFRAGGPPLLIDFPFLAYGPTLTDVAFFLPSVAGEGGPLPQHGLRLYEQISCHRFDPRDVALAVAIIAGFFASRAGQADIPGLPRLRWVQKLQLFPSLTWLIKLLEIEPPPHWRPF